MFKYLEIQAIKEDRKRGVLTDGDYRRSYRKTTAQLNDFRLDTVQDYSMKLGIKPCVHLWEISIFSLNHVILRLTKIVTKAGKKIV